MTGVVLVAAVVVVAAVVTGGVVVVLVVVIVVAGVVVACVVEQLASNNDIISKDESSGIIIDLIFILDSFLIFVWKQVSNSCNYCGNPGNRLSSTWLKVCRLYFSFTAFPLELRGNLILAIRKFLLSRLVVLFPPFIIWLFK